MYFRGKVNIDTDFKQFQVLQVSCTKEIHDSCGVLVEKSMTPHSSSLAWRIPWMEEPGELQSMGSRRVGHD